MSTSHKKRFSSSPSKRKKRLNTEGLDSSHIKMTTHEVSRDQLIEDYAVLFFNIKQLKQSLPEKRVLKVYEKLLTNPFSADSDYPLKNDMERLLFLQLEELRAITTMMIEIMYNDLSDEKKKQIEEKQKDA